MTLLGDILAAELEALWLAVRAGAADAEVVRATASRIAAGDADAWLREWTAAGGERWAAAQDHDGGPAYLHAASYYAAALAVIAHTDGSVAEDALTARQRICWDLGRHDPGGAGAAHPLRRHGTAGPPARRRRRPRGRSSSPSTEGCALPPTAGARVGAAAHARGWHWMTFDGPASPRPDWGRG